jgi:hypothetical protein
MGYNSFSRTFVFGSLACPCRGKYWYNVLIFSLLGFDELIWSVEPILKIVYILKSLGRPAAFEINAFLNEKSMFKLRKTDVFLFVFLLFHINLFTILKVHLE